MTCSGIISILNGSKIRKCNKSFIYYPIVDGFYIYLGLPFNSAYFKNLAQSVSHFMIENNLIASGSIKGFIVSTQFNRYN